MKFQKKEIKRIIYYTKLYVCTDILIKKKEKIKS